MTDKQAMAATFTEVTLEDMEKFLKRSFRVLRPKRLTERGEVVYVLHLGKFVGVKVFTSVRPSSGVGADVGQDAIRVGLVSLKDGGPLERGKFPIVKRTQNWRDSLTDRVEDCIEKYEDKEDFWENWAETRKRQDPRQQQETVQDPDVDEKAEREQEAPPPIPTPAAPIKQYDPDRMRGDITPPQAKFLRVLLRGITQSEWAAIGGENLTGRDSPPDYKGVENLTKGQASKLIDALKRRGGNRYAEAKKLMWKR